MSLLQETTPKADLLSKRDTMKVEPEDSATLKNQLNSVAFPSFPNTTMFTPHFLMASQLMAASAAGLTFPTTAGAFFHPSLFAPPWPSSSPPSPPSATEQISATHKSRKHINNNNNIVSSSSGEHAGNKPTKRKLSVKVEIEENVSPTSSTSPPASGDSGGRVSANGGAVGDANRDRQFTCGVCNRSFGYKHVLQNHERTHTGEKPFECQECHKRFTRDHHLKTHMRLHTGERPYHCDHCDRQFVQVANLRRHLRVHTGERPYVCEHCQARFSDSNQLKAHLLIHTNEKPFSCEHCRSRFRRRHHLLHHKCGIVQKEAAVTDVASEAAEHQDEPRSKRVLEPLVTLPLRVSLPEQTEPEDLSMSTGIHSNSSGVSTRSASSREDVDDDEEEEDEEHAATLFLQKRPPSSNS